MTAANDSGVALLRTLAATVDPRALLLLSADLELVEANAGARQVIGRGAADLDGLSADAIGDALGLSRSAFDALLSAARGSDLSLPFLASVTVDGGARIHRKAVVQALRSGGALAGYAIRLSAGVDPLEAFRAHRLDLERREAEAAVLVEEETLVMAERARVVRELTGTADAIDGKMRRLLRTLAALRTARPGMIDEVTLHGLRMAEEEARAMEAALVDLVGRIRSKS